VTQKNDIQLSAGIDTTGVSNSIQLIEQRIVALIGKLNSLPSATFNPIDTSRIAGATAALKQLNVVHGRVINDMIQQESKLSAFANRVRKVSGQQQASLKANPEVVATAGDKNAGATNRAVGGRSRQADIGRINQTAKGIQQLTSAEKALSIAVQKETAAERHANKIKDKTQSAAKKQEAIDSKRANALARLEKARVTNNNGAKAFIATENKLSEATVRLNKVRAKAEQQARKLAGAERKLRAQEKAITAGAGSGGLAAGSAAAKRLNDIISKRIEIEKRRARADRGAIALAHKLAVVENKQRTAIDKVTQATKKKTAAEHSARKEEEKMGAVTRFLVDGLSKSSRVIAVFQGPLGPLAGRLTAAAAALRGMGKWALGAGVAMGILRSVVQRAIPAAIDLQRVMATLSAATSDANKSFALVVAESERTGAGFKKLGDSFAQIAAAARGTALEGEGINKVFHAIDTAALALRLGTVETAGALKALEQMISKGTVSSEEMRQQLGERLPGAFRLAADSMGMTTAAFSKNMALGKIMANDLLPKLSAAIEKAYGASAAEAARTLGAAMERLTNQTNLFFGQLVSSQLLDSFTGSVDSATSAMKTFGDAIHNDLVDGDKLREIFAVTWPLAAGTAILWVGKITFAVTGLKGALVALEDVALLAPFVGWAGVIGKVGKVVASLGISWWAVKNGIDSATAAEARFAALPEMKRLPKQIAAVQAKIDKLQKHINNVPAFRLDGVDPTTTKLGKLKATAARLRARLDELKASAIDASDSLVVAGKTMVSALTESDTLISHQLTVQARQVLVNNDLIKTSTKTVSKRTALIAKLEGDLNNKRVHFAARRGEEANAALDATARQLDATKTATKVEVAELAKRIRGLKKQNAEDIANKTALAKRTEDLVHITDMQATKQRKADATKNALDAAAVVAAKNNTDELVLQNKLLNAKKGSANARHLKQQLAAKVLSDQLDLALTKETDDKKRVLIQARFDLRKRKLDQSVSDEEAAAAKKIAIAKAESKGVIDAAIEKTRLLKQQLKDSQSSVSDVINGTGKSVQDPQAGLADAKNASRLAFKARKKAIEDQANLEIAQGKDAGVVAAEVQRNLDDARLQQKLTNNQALLDAEKQHQSNIHDLKNQFAALGSKDHKVNIEQGIADVKSFYHRVQGWDKLGAKGRLNLVASGFDALSGLMQSKNRKLFEVGKIAAISNTVIKTIESAQSVFTSVQAEIPGIAGTVVASIAAAATLAAGYQNVRKIQSTQFGGGATSGGASRPAISDAAFLAKNRTPAFNPNFTQRPTTPPVTGNTGLAQQGVTIVQHISAPNAQAGAAFAIQQGAALGAQQALQAVGQDFTTNGPLRQALAV